MKIRISQIAIAVPGVDSFAKRLSDVFGVKMYTDHLQMDGEFKFTESRSAIQEIFGEPSASTANHENVQLSLAFEHSLMEGVELEYISSNSFLHWHFEHVREYGPIPFLSHLGMYCEDEKEFSEIIAHMHENGFSRLQDTVSKNHTNLREGDEFVSSRKYKDVIFDSRDRLGFNLKLSLKV